MTRVASQALSPDKNAEHLRVVLHEGGAQGLLEDRRRFELMRELLEAGHPVSRRVQTAALPEGEASSVAPDAHPPLAILHEGVDLSTPSGSPTSEGAAPTVDVRGLTAEEARERVVALRDARSLPAPGAWTPWFPVIDYQRCTNCMQCLSFCLFDVYGVDEEGRIQVRNEDKCKTNCPACSRVCPEVAILFPKYKKGPINGAEVKAEDIANESMKVDISALLGGDIYSTLKDRHAGARKRFSTERDESKALLERKRCLKELGETLDIPPEVLMSLPSAGEIEERARRAQEKMVRRRAVSQSVKDQEKDAGARPASPEEWGI